MNIPFLKEKGNKYVCYILLGVLLLLLAVPNKSTETGMDTSDIYNGKTDLESGLERILTAMEGVGKVEVMITREEGETSVFKNDTDSEKVCGVVVVAQGAGNAIVEKQISEVIQALFSIDAHKISIVKMSSQEDNH